MKNLKVLLIILAAVSLLAAIWTVRLNNSYRTLLNKKLDLENKLIQVLKDNDFISTQLNDLERKLEDQKQESKGLAEQLDQAMNTIETLQNEILILTQAKQELGDQINALMEKTEIKIPVKPEETAEVQIQPTSQAGYAIQERSSSMPENVLPVMP